MDNRTVIADINEEFVLQVNGMAHHFQMMNYEGTGSSCMVYKVRDLEVGRQMILKEFYPLGDEYHIQRENRVLIVDQETSQNPQFCRIRQHFLDGYMYLQQFGEHNETVNHTTRLELCGLIESNNTYYILQEWVNGSKLQLTDQQVSLAQMVEILMYTAGAIGQYHKLGFLHLDISPNNILFLKNDELDTGYVKLFDFDTVIEKKSIKKNGSYKYRTTENFSAPELIYASENLSFANFIAETADVYSIGAMLIKAITGKYATQITRNWHGVESSTAQWESLLQEMKQEELGNPMTIRYLSEFFSKTLNPKPTQRYQNMNEVVCVLQEILTAINTKIHLVNSTFSSGTKFIGRRDEIHEIQAVLKKENGVVLHGIGGMGKSVLSRKYVEENRDLYNYVIIYDYSKGDNLQTAIDKIIKSNVRFSKQTKNEYGQHLLTIDEEKSLLRQLCENHSVIVIIDNFNVDYDQYINDFMAIGWKVIFTTRNNLRGNLSIIEIETLPELEELFMEYYRENDSSRIFDASDRYAITSLLDCIHWHTITAELLAKEISINHLDIRNVQNEIIEVLTESDESFIPYIRDDVPIEDSVYQILRSVFKIVNLSDKQMRILQYLCLLQFPISISELIKYAHLDAIAYRGVDRQLLNKGWIIKDYHEQELDDIEPEYYIHPVISEVLCHEFVFDEENCGVISNEIIQTYEQSVMTGCAEVFKAYVNLVMWMYSIFSLTKLDVVSTLNLMRNLVTGLWISGWEEEAIVIQKFRMRYEEKNDIGNTASAFIYICMIEAAENREKMYSEILSFPLLTSVEKEHLNMMCITHRMDDYEFISFLASKGNAFANFRLAFLDADIENQEKAISHLEYAANRGLGIAQLMLAEMYYDGTTVKRDKQEGVKELENQGIEKEEEACEQVAEVNSTLESVSANIDDDLSAAVDAVGDACKSDAQQYSEATVHKDLESAYKSADEVIEEGNEQKDLSSDTSNKMKNAENASEFGRSAASEAGSSADSLAQEFGEVTDQTNLEKDETEQEYQKLLDSIIG